jgi:hypothetical protein
MASDMEFDVILIDGGNLRLHALEKHKQLTMSLGFSSGSVSDGHALQL